jgi:hypothetical protein
MSFELANLQSRDFSNPWSLDPVHFELSKHFFSAFLDDELDFGDGSVAVGVRHRPS